MESYLINSGHRKATANPVGSLPVIALFCAAVLTSNSTAAQAARRPGAARTLRLTGTDPQHPGLPWQSGNAIDDSSLSQPVFGRGEGGTADLFFTRSTGGVQNLWRTRLPIVDPKAKEAGETEGRRPGGAARDALLDAAPITQLSAPYFATSAAPSPDGRWLLCVTNSGLSAMNIAAGHSAIARLELNSGKLTPLTDGSAADSAPAVSPDGSRFAFVSDRDGFPAVYLQDLKKGTAERVAPLARHPYWLDDETLIFENTRPGSGGLYKVAVPDDGKPAKAQFLWKRAGAAAASHNGRWLGVSTTGSSRDSADVTRLYLLAPDGSGARSIGATEGARALSFAPDDSAIVFEGLTGEAREGARPLNEKHTLWILPMLRVAPTASLSGVRPVRGARPVSAGAIAPLDLYGSIFCEGGNPERVSLEWGEGDEPKSWKNLPVQNESANKTPLARWTPPAAEGSWTFRLNVTDADGDSTQSLLTVSLPLENAETNAAPVFSTEIPAIKPAAPEDFPSVSPAAAKPPVVPVVTAPTKPQPGTVKNRVALRAVPKLPLPALPPAPDKTPVPAEEEAAPVTRAPESSSDPAPPPLKPQPAVKKPKKIKKPRPVPTPRPTPAPEPPEAKPAPTQQKRPGDAAVVTVSGVPISMTVGQTAQLEATLRNTGRNGWKIDGDAPVRLLIYWRDIATGRRTRWNIRWLRAGVPPGGLTKLSFELQAPARPGHFQLRFCLVRVEGGSYTAPPISVTTMPGEFGVASTTMDVE